MIDLMHEFSVDVVGTAFVMATATPTAKRIQGEKSLMVMDVRQDAPESLTVEPAPWLLNRMEDDRA